MLAVAVLYVLQLAAVLAYTIPWFIKNPHITLQNRDVFGFLVVACIESVVLIPLIVGLRWLSRAPVYTVYRAPFELNLNASPDFCVSWRKPRASNIDLEEVCEFETNKSPYLAACVVLHAMSIVSIWGGIIAYPMNPNVAMPAFIVMSLIWFCYVVMLPATILNKADEEAYDEKRYEQANEELKRRLRVRLQEVLDHT